jgi:hypothetical protein
MIHRLAICCNVAGNARQAMRMEMNSSWWNTHNWIIRRLKLVPGKPLIQMGCRECGREFVDECATGDR